VAAAVQGRPDLSIRYDNKLKAAHSQLSEKLYGHPSVEDRPPMRYTSEKLCVEYLYEQMGKTFQYGAADEEDIDDVTRTVWWMKALRMWRTSLWASRCHRTSVRFSPVCWSTVRCR